MQVVEGVATVADVDEFLEALAEIGEKTGCTIQAFDARYVVGRDHLQRAVELADRAFERRENVARDRGVEILLFAAGRRQIDRAFEMGIGEGEQPAVVLVDSPEDDETGEEAGAERVRDLLEPAETLGIAYADRQRVRAFFEITDAEMEAAAGSLQDLVIERVALLVVER